MYRILFILAVVVCSLSAMVTAWDVFPNGQPWLERDAGLDSGDEPCGQDVREVDTRRVSDAIFHVVDHGVERYGILPFKWHNMARDENSRLELSRAIVSAVGRHVDVPLMLMVAIAFRENSFGGVKRGSLGERSTFQIIPKVAGYIRGGKFPWSDISEPECDLSTIDGSALCAAALLTIHRGRCRTLEGSLSLYASGRTCRPDTSRLRWIIRDRFGLAKYLERKFPRG